MPSSPVEGYPIYPLFPVYGQGRNGSRKTFLASRFLTHKGVQPRDHGCTLPSPTVRDQPTVGRGIFSPQGNRSLLFATLLIIRIRASGPRPPHAGLITKFHLLSRQGVQFCCQLRHPDLDQSQTPSCVSCLFRASSLARIRSSRRRNLPVAVLGTSSRKTISRGYL